MDCFAKGDIVGVDKLLYEYPDYPWLTPRMSGYIVKQIPTNNKRGAKRFLISFSDIGKEAKLYSDEIKLVCKNCNKFIKKEIDVTMNFVEEIDNDIVKEFYETSLKNINEKYETKISEVKKGDPINYLFHTTKKGLAEKLNIPIDSLKIEINLTLQENICLSTDSAPIRMFNDFCLIDGEPFSKGIKEAISDFSEKKKIEVTQLNDLCKKADTVVSYAEEFCEMRDILSDYGIMKYNNTINETYGIEKDNSKKGD